MENPVGQSKEVKVEIYIFLAAYYDYNVWKHGRCSCNVTVPKGYCCNVTTLDNGISGGTLHLQLDVAVI